MRSERAVAAEMDDLAAVYEQRAKSLRDLAAQVRSLADVEKAPEQAADAPELPAPPSRTQPIPSEWYVDAMRTDPERDWDSEQLSERLAAMHAGEPNKDAARTMMYRLEKRGLVRKSGRGTWRLVSDSAPAASQDPLGRPFVSVVR